MWHHDYDRAEYQECELRGPHSFLFLMWKGNVVGKKGVKRSSGIAEERLVDSEVLSDFKLMALSMSRREMRVLRAHIKIQKQRGNQRPASQGRRR